MTRSRVGTATGRSGKSSNRERLLEAQAYDPAMAGQLFGKKRQSMEPTPWLQSFL
jgi:hypothetical protein